MRLSSRRLLNSARRLNIPDLFINSLFYSKLSASESFSSTHQGTIEDVRLLPFFPVLHSLFSVCFLPLSVSPLSVPAAGALSNSSSPFNPVSLKWSCLSLLTTEAHDRFAFEPSVVGE